MEQLKQVVINVFTEGGEKWTKGYIKHGEFSVLSQPGNGNFLW